MLEDAVDPYAPRAASPVAAEDLRIALGPNDEPYMALWRRAQRARLGHYGSWCWWGFLTPLPWLFYRKLWAVGAALVLLPILSQAVLDTGAKAGFGLMALVGGFGMPMVIERCQRKARRVQALGLPAGEAIERLRKAGGVSLPGAIFGGLLTFSYLALVFGFKGPLALPACDDPVVIETALLIAHDSAADIGFDPRDIRLEAIDERDAARGRHCWALLRSGDKELAVAYDVIWQNKSQRTISVDMSTRAAPESGQP
ncbi:MAG: DUF2628 domain-containing protein [Pseudomonadota bacterium]